MNYDELRAAISSTKQIVLGYDVAARKIHFDVQATMKLLSEVEFLVDANNPVGSVTLGVTADQVVALYLPKYQAAINAIIASKNAMVVP